MEGKLMRRIKYIILSGTLWVSTIVPMMGLVDRSYCVAERAKKRSDIFFNVEDRETLKDHVDELKKTIDMLSGIIRDNCQLYKISKDKTYLKLLAVLLPARAVLMIYYKALSKDHSSVLDMSLSLKRMIDGIKKSGVLDEFFAAMVNLEVALSGKELEVFHKMKDLIFDYNIPGYVDCIRALNKYF